MQEKRRFARLDVRVKVEYEIVQAPESKFKSFTKNLSQGGICLFLDSSLKKDTLLDIKLYIPDQPEPLEASGKVVWVESFKIGGSDAREHFEAGIQFVDISSEDQNKIGKYVFGTLKVK